MFQITCQFKAITANKISTQSKNLIRTVPRNQSYVSTTKYGKIIYRVR